MVACTKLALLTLIHTLSLSGGVKYLYYHPITNRPIPITLANASRVFDPSANTVFIVPGLGSTTPWVSTMASLLNRYAAPTTVIGVDYVEHLIPVQEILECKSIGDHLGEFILTTQMPLARVHLIGHSMGTIISGFAGQRVGKGRIGRITGLDPSGTVGFFTDLFLDALADLRLSKDDAEFVDVIHTQRLLKDGGLWGHADFLVNGVVAQPGCHGLSTVPCSHSLAHSYYSLSIQHPDLYPSYNKVTGKRTYMGHWVARTEGRYHVQANNTGVDVNKI